MHPLTTHALAQHLLDDRQRDAATLRLVRATRDQRHVPERAWRRALGYRLIDVGVRLAASPRPERPPDWIT
jgi:hypothetical protein